MLRDVVIPPVAALSLRGMKNLSAILLLFAANSISGVAQGISLIAVPWYFAREGQLGRFGLIYIVISLISVFWSPYSGTLVDRFNRKHIFLALTTVVGLLVLATALLGFQQGDLPWYLVGGVFGLTFLNFNLHYPNLYAFVQEITERPYYGRITSYIEIQGQVTNMLAGAAGAMLLEGTRNGKLNVFGFYLELGFDIEPWQIYEIFLLDAATYFLSFLIILLIRFTPLQERRPEKGTLLRQLRTGLDFLRDHPYLFLFGVASYSIFATVLVVNFFLGALYVSDHLRAPGDVFASSEMFFAVGAVLAGAGIRWVFQRTTQPMTVIVLTALAAAIFVTLALGDSIPLYYAGTFLLGLTNAGTRVMRTTYLFDHVPNQVYGRTSSIFFLTNIFFRILFLGLFSLAFFQQDGRVVIAFGILSAFLAAATLIMGRFYRRLV